MLSIEGKHRFIAAGMFILPLILVKFTGVLFAPAGVEATETTAQTPVEALPAPQARGLTPAQQAAIDRVEELRAMPFGPSPLYYDRSDETQPIQIDITGEPPPNFKVKAIMEASVGDIASINDRFYREGQKLDTSTWTIVEIDAVRRSVTIENDEGDQAVRFVEGP